MKPPEPEASDSPSPRAVEILCERLQRMGVSISEPAARNLLESVFAAEGAHLHSRARAALQASLEMIRQSTDAALSTLTGAPPEPPRRDYELSFSPPNLVGALKDRAAAEAEQRGRAPGRRPAPSRHPAAPHDREIEEEEPRPVFKRPRR
jgi:hypothetical protein